MKIHNRNIILSAVIHFSSKSERLSPNDSEHCSNLLEIAQESIKKSAHTVDESKPEVVS